MQLRRPFTVTFAALLSLGALLGAVAAARADNGGATPDEITFGGATPVVVHVAENAIAHATGGGISIAVRTTATQQGGIHVTGTAPAKLPGGTVRIERFDAKAGWVAVATVAIADHGSFGTRWRPDRLGLVQLRAVAGGETTAADAAGVAATPQVSVNVYRRGVASWYDPVGATTACGVVVDRSTVGVAHRTLPCGTPVAFYYRGRTIVVPVIDRGPYIHGRSWDLTRTAFRALGGGDNGLLTLGALAQPAAAGSARQRG